VLGCSGVGQVASRRAGSGCEAWEYSERYSEHQGRSDGQLSGERSCRCGGEVASGPVGRRSGAPAGIGGGEHADEHACMHACEQVGERVVGAAAISGARRDALPRLSRLIGAVPRHHGAAGVVLGSICA